MWILKSEVLRIKGTFYITAEADFLNYIVT